MTRCMLEISSLVAPSSATTWVLIFLAIFYMARVAVFVQHVSVVLRALLDEHDPDRQRILRDVLRDLLELFRNRRRR